MNTWFRLYSEFSTDPKVQMMSEAMQRRLIMLMCLRCSDVTVTVTVTDRDEAVAFAMRISASDLEETKALFLRKGFIDEQWNLLAWDRRQFASDSSAERTRRYRSKQKEGGGEGCDDAKRHGDALEQTQNRTEQSREEPRAVGEAISSTPVGAPPPTDAGRACKLMAEAGIPPTRCNPSNAKLLDALAEGVTPEALADAVPGAIEANATNPFLWAITVARGEHAKRGSAPPEARAGPTGSMSRMAQANANLDDLTLDDDGNPTLRSLAAGRDQSRHQAIEHARS